MARAVLGLSCWYHDSAAALVVDGRVVAAAHEERGSRVKFDARFPAHAVRTVLQEAGCRIGDVEAVVVADKPLLKTDRILMTALAMAPRGRRMFVAAFGARGEARFGVRGPLRRALARAVGERSRHVPPPQFVGHHEAHAAGAFFTSRFDESAVLCLDSVGEWSAVSAWRGSGHRLEPLWEQRFPHSPGLLYSAVTRWLGLRANVDEYKVMGLAAFGEPRFRDAMLERLVLLRDDGSFRLAAGFLAALDGRRDAKQLTELFGAPPSEPAGPDNRHAADVAASVQAVLEEIVLRSAASLREQTGIENLCLAGGVALNGRANGRLVREGGWREVWAQSAPGDAGNAVGAALIWSLGRLGARRPAEDVLAGARLGRSIATDTPTSGTLTAIAERLAKGQIVGWCHGRAEWGPRALGGRSILADPRDADMQDRLNRIIKQREGYRPFAPVVRHRDCGAWFPGVESCGLARWMLVTVPVPLSTAAAVPAAVHVDGSARVQVLHDENDPLAGLLDAFGQRTGVPILVNTSFNGPDEPIVDDESDARRAAARLGLDALVIGDRVLEPADFQPPAPPSAPAGWRDYLPAGAALVLAGLLWPSAQAGRPTVSWGGVIAGVLLALWAIAAPVCLRAARLLLLRAVRAALSLPGRLLLSLVWLLLLLPMSLAVCIAGFDPLDLRGTDSPRRAPPPGGPPGAPY